MYILLESGMEFKAGDESYNHNVEKWELVDLFMAGKYVTDNHYPIRRKISSIDELFASYNSEYMQGLKQH